MGLTGGIDWASREHAVCILDAAGAVRSRFVVAHSAAGLGDLRRRLARFGAPSTLPIAVERPSGVLVDPLVEAGYAVVPIHPNALRATRSRYRAAGSKSDAEDAFILADLLRTDGHRYRALRPPSAATRTLRALVRTRDDLVAARVALANQLRELLASFWPGAAEMFAALDSPIALAFLTRYPTPASAARLGEQRLAAFLARHHYSGGREGAELLARLRAAPAGCAGQRESAAKGQLVRALVRVLEPLVAELQYLTAAVEQAVTSHPDGPLLMSFPRAGKVNAAQMLAELGDDRARFTSPEHLAAEGGVAPVTAESGKHRAVRWRWACNRRLRRSLTCWANNSRHTSPWAAAHYARAVARGCDHPHAVRILARAWARVLWRCWQDGSPYDPTRHSAAKPFLNAA